ncbi:MAG: hypothetical protein COB93_04630 [Sneathiella sp.]|nr:MAG: hypothetical protein COB93_04630 [Sneathiella sp.]
MTEYFGEFNEIAKVQRERVRQQDHDDLNNERSGIETGRIPRFLSAEAWDAIRKAKTGRSRSSDSLSALEFLLLNDPEYATLYKVAVKENRAVQHKLFSFQERSGKAIKTAKDDVENSVANAATLPDGRKAHLDKNGIAWTIENEMVDVATTAGIDWTSRETRESHLAKVERLSDLKQAQAESEGLDIRLGEIDNALRDSDDPPTKDELKALHDESKAISEQVDGLNRTIDAALIDRTIENQTDASPRDLATMTVLPKI